MEVDLLFIAGATFAAQVVVVQFAITSDMYRTGGVGGTLNRIGGGVDRLLLSFGLLLQFADACFERLQLLLQIGLRVGIRAGTGEDR